MSSSKIKDVLYIIGLVLGLLFFVKQLIDSMSFFINNHTFSINFRYLLWSLLLSILIYFVQLNLWLSCMCTIGIHVEWAEAMRGYWISFLPRYVPGGVWGYFGRNEWLYRKYKIPYQVTNFGSILEASITCLSGLLLFSLSVETTVTFVYKVFLILIVLILFFISLDKITKLKIIQTPNFLTKFIALNQIGINLKDGLLCSFYSFVNWSLYGLLLIFVSKAIISTNFLVSVDTFIKSVGIYSISWITGFLIFFIPSGLGVREYLLAFQTANLYKLPIEQTTGIGVIIRMFLLFTEVLWIIVALVLRRNSKLEKTNSI